MVINSLKQEDTVAAKGRATGDSQRSTLWWFLVITIACSTAGFSFGPLSPFLIETFGISRAETGLFTVIVSSAAGVLAVAAGWAVDRVGVRLCLLLGTVTVGLFLAGLAQSHRIELAYFCAFAIGVGNTFLNPAMVKGLMLSYPPERRATVVGLRQSGVTIGMAIAGVAIPSLSLALSWGWAVAIIGAIIVILGLLNIPMLRDLDSGGTARAKPASVRQIWQVFKSRNIILVGVVSAGYIATQLSLLTYLVLYLTEARDFTIQAAGVVLAGVGISGSFARVVWGSISDRLFHGRRKPVALIIGLMSLAASVTVGIFGVSMPVWLLWCTLVFFGFSAVGWNGLILTFAAEVGPVEMPATAVGSMMTLSTVGVFFVSLFGYIVDSTSSYGLAWLLLSVWCAISVAATVFIHEKRMAT